MTVFVDIIVYSKLLSIEYRQFVTQYRLPTYAVYCVYYLYFIFTDNNVYRLMVGIVKAL